MSRNRSTGNRSHDAGDLHQMALAVALIDVACDILNEEGFVELSDELFTLKKEIHSLGEIASGNVYKYIEGVMKISSSGVSYNGVSSVSLMMGRTKSLQNLDRR